VLGQQGEAPSNITIQLRNGGVVFSTQSPAMPQSGDFAVQCGSGEQGFAGRRFDAVLSGTGTLTIDSLEMQIEIRPVGVLTGAIS
jgi:hypothetical protein